MTFTLTDKQIEARSMLASSAKNSLIYGGSRSGKTFLLCYATLTRAVKAPGSRHAIFRRHGVAVKQSIGKDTLPAVAALAYPGLELKWREQDGYFILPNGSEIWLAGLDDKERVDKILGREFCTLYFNEASEIPLSSYMVATTRLAQQVKQVDGRMLPLKNYVDLNPTTSAHWTYQMWVKGVHPDGGAKLQRHSEDFAHMVMNPTHNAANLSEDYIRDLAAMPERQRKRFFDGLFTADDDNALWRRQWIRHDGDALALERVVVAIDPAVTAQVGSDSTGLIVAGKVAGQDRGVVLADESGKFRPEEWARRAISLYDTYDADCIVGEVNQGGDMVSSTVRAAAKGRAIPFHAVTATKAKQVRAEPIAALYELGKVSHAQEFPELEDEMCAFTIGFDRKAAGYSPDRVDALVWAMTDLFPRMTQRKNIRPPVQRVTAAMPMMGR